MEDIGLVPFGYFFPQQAAIQTRVLITRRHPVLPEDEYALMESYCPEANCNCRRVMLNVLAKRQKAILASISYGFDRDDEFAGPFLDPMNRQSKYAKVLLTVVAEVLTDPEYVARLRAHYDQVKGMAADPNHPSQAMLARLAADGSHPPQSRRAPRQAKKRK